MGKVMLEGYECERCGHRWVKREATEGDPVICPKCKSPYWNRPRVSDASKKAAIKKFYGRKEEQSSVKREEKQDVRN